MTATDAQNMFLNQLRADFPEFNVEALPDDPQNRPFHHPKGDIWVAYNASTYNERSGLRQMTFLIHQRMRGLNTADGAINVVDRMANSIPKVASDQGTAWLADDTLDARDDANGIWYFKTTVHIETAKAGSSAIKQVYFSEVTGDDVGGSLLTVFGNRTQNWYKATPVGPENFALDYQHEINFLIAADDVGTRQKIGTLTDKVIARIKITYWDNKTVLLDSGQSGMPTLNFVVSEQNLDGVYSFALHGKGIMGDRAIITEPI